jgi:hypothetical protein
MAAVGGVREGFVMDTVTQTRRASLGARLIVALLLGLGGCAQAGSGDGDQASGADGASTPPANLTLDSGSTLQGSYATSGANSLNEDAWGEDVYAEGSDAAADGDVSNPAPPTGDDGEGPPEAGTAGDAALEAETNPPPPCSQTCTTGCCDSDGLCQGGTSDALCGAGGASCTDCTVSSPGQTCQSHACRQAAPPPDAGTHDAGTTPDAGSAQDAGTPVPDAGSTPDAGTPVPDAGSTPDAGAPVCAPSACTNLCVPYFVQCCKADNTCGCSLFYPPGPCN